jgi:hypothetical protein
VQVRERNGWVGSNGNENEIQGGGEIMGEVEKSGLGKGGRGGAGSIHKVGNPWLNRKVLYTVSDH